MRPRARACLHDHTVILVVVGAEDEFGICGLDVGQLSVEVLVARGIAFFGYYGDAQLCALGLESLIQAYGVVVAGLYDDSGLGVAQLFLGILSHLFALEGIDEAGAEHIGVNRTVIGIYGDGLVSGGGGDHGHIDGICLAGNSNGVGGDNIADECRDALVYLAVEGIDGLGVIALVVVGDELDLFAVEPPSAFTLSK